MASLSISEVREAIRVLGDITQALLGAGTASAECCTAIGSLTAVKTVLESYLKIEIHGAWTEAESTAAVQICVQTCCEQVMVLSTRLSTYEEALSKQQAGLAKTKHGVHGTYKELRWSISLERDLARLGAEIGPQLNALKLLRSITQVHTQLSESEKEAAHCWEMLVAIRDIQRQVQPSGSESRPVTALERQEDTEALLGPQASPSPSAAQEVDSPAGRRPSTPTPAAWNSALVTDTAEGRLEKRPASLSVRIRRLFIKPVTPIARGPTLLLDNDIHFQDALGRISRLPYEYFRSCPCFLRDSGTISTDCQAS